MKMLYRNVEESSDVADPYFQRGFEIIFDWRQFLLGGSIHEGCATLQLGFIAFVWWWSND